VLGRGAKKTHEVVYGVTSLSAEAASPARLLALARGHWSIENRSHWVRDHTFDEDRCRARRGRGAWMLAALRNLAIGLLRLAKANSIAAGVRSCAQVVTRAMRLLGVTTA
jgi:predicted transposase YbfD/YdcC